MQREAAAIRAQAEANNSGLTYYAWLVGSGIMLEHWMISTTMPPGYDRRDTEHYAVFKPHRAPLHPVQASPHLQKGHTR